MNSVWLNRLAMLLCWAGLAIAGLLSYEAFTGLVLPCGGTSGCETVALHPSSGFGPVKVAYIGTLGYLLLALVTTGKLLGPKDKRPMLDRAAVLLSGFGLLFSMYLMYTSLVVIKALCVWCLASAVTMTLLFIVSFLGSRAKEGRSEDKYDMLAVFGGLVLAFGFAAVQSQEMEQGVLKTIGSVNLGGLNTSEMLPEYARIKGNADAKLTVIEYADMNCPTCRAFYAEADQIYAEYNGKLRMAYRHLPLFEQNGHETSLLAAVVAQYAAKKGVFWEYMSSAMSQANRERMLTADGVKGVAVDSGLDLPGIEAAADGSSPESDQVAKDMELALKLNIRYTPTFIIFGPGVPPVAASTRTLRTVLKSSPYRELLQ